MGFFDKLFGRKKPATPSAGEMARERLTLMLVHDRLKLTPDLLDRIKEELLAVISKYVEIDESGVDVELTHSEHSDKLVARMPVKRQRLQFQRDVLEPGMGNPLAAAAALAEIHQPPASATDTPPASAPPEPVPDPPQPAAESSAPESANAAPAPTIAEVTPPSEEGQPVKEESEPAKAAEAVSASTEDKTEPESATSAADPAPPAESAATEAGALSAQAADEAPAQEIPSSATTPTKG